MLFFWIFVFILSCVNCVPLSNVNNTRYSRNLQYRNINENNCDCDCGVSKSRVRIIGGTEINPHEFPWLAGLVMGGDFRCGASVITRRHLLTAAHCVHGYDISKIQVILAAHDRLQESTFTTRGIKSAKTHIGFEPRTYNNDIAILEMDHPVDYSTDLQPACLPRDSDVDYTHRAAMIAGWGLQEERGHVSQFPKKLEVPIWSHQDCLDKTGYQTNRITLNMFCAGFEQGGKDACQGDSGGPIHVLNDAGNMEIIGLVSWGRGCARPKLPGLYTKVTNYLDWIAESLDGECMCSA